MICLDRFGMAYSQHQVIKKSKKLWMVKEITLILLNQTSIKNWIYLLILRGPYINQANKKNHQNLFNF
jgi:hypothetical protein